jgi:hypothetical protein
MSEVGVDPSILRSTRRELHRVATHVLARRRFDATGRFGLRATPGGFGTPAFGPPDCVEVVRVAGSSLVHEVGGQLRVVTIDGATLAELAATVGVDLGREFRAGDDTPELGDADAPLVIDEAAAWELAGWYDLGWRALDIVGIDAVDPAPIQLWPEHFDASCLLAVGPGPDDRCDVGVSPGDHHHEEPYLYVSPWVTRRPGDEAYWNAPFGAVRARAAVASVPDAVGFYREGLSRLRG